MSTLHFCVWLKPTHRAVLHFMLGSEQMFLGWKGCLVTNPTRESPWSCLGRSTLKVVNKAFSPWAQSVTPSPPGSSMSGTILFRGPHWSIIKMLTPYKLADPTFLGTFQNGRHRNLSKIELLISWSLVSLETQIWCLNPHFQGHWIQWECYKCDNIMYLWEIQDGCHFQLPFWPIWCNPRHKLFL